MSSDGHVRDGLVVVYTGHGKGKTTAAMGMIVRALGWKQSVAVVQFIKGKRRSGEWNWGEAHPDVPFHVMGRDFTWESEDLSLDKRAAEGAWAKSLEFINDPAYDIVILDEITYTFNWGFLDLEDVIEGLKARPKEKTVVLTGRNAPDALVEVADLVTEMRVVKHPYESGVPALKGVDF